MTPRIVFLDRATLPIPIRAPRVPHELFEHAFTTTADVIVRAEGAAVLIPNKVKITAEHIAQLPALRLVALAATGTNNVDLEACRRAGVAVTNVRGYAKTAVAEHVFTVTLALRRSLRETSAQATNGEWAKSPVFCVFGPPIGELSGSTFGVVGSGSIGTRVAELARAFGMSVMLAERRGAPTRPGRVAFETVLRESDVLGLFCPLTDDTRNLIGRDELRAMKPGAILVNAARGGLVDEPALVEALRSGHLGGAAVDVLTREPPLPENPLLDPTIPRLILTPHIAWASATAIAALGEQLTETLEAFFEGRPMNVVVEGRR